MVDKVERCNCSEQACIALVASEYFGFSLSDTSTEVVETTFSTTRMKICMPSLLIVNHLLRSYLSSLLLTNRQY